MTPKQAQKAGALSGWKQILLLGAALLSIMLSPAVNAQRWYQIEVSIFTHESSDREMENWPELGELEVDFPDELRRLGSWRRALELPDWTRLQPRAADDENHRAQGLRPFPRNPQPQREQQFKLPDPQRDPFVILPAGQSGFTDTNQRLENSPEHRLLYHALWRQPVTQAAGAVPLAVTGGRQYGSRHELEGSLQVYFNPPETRVVLDTDVWLSEFSNRDDARAANEILPPLPGLLTGGESSTPDVELLPADSTISPDPGTNEEVPGVTRVLPMRQTRPMRSNEFHYLDHPALGVVVEVFPYEPPSTPDREPAMLPRLSMPGADQSADAPE